MPKLFIRMLSPVTRHDEGFSVRGAWMIQEDDGRVRARGETDFRGLSELIDPGSDWTRQPNNIIVTVPSEYVLSLSCSVPGRSVGQMRRALPFVVEEFVTTDIEGMHLATGPISRGAPVRCSLIDRSLLDGWLDCLGDLGVRPGYLFSEAELLPLLPDGASLLVDDFTLLLRTPDQAVTLDRDNVVLALGALEVNRLRIVYGSLSDIELGQLDPELEVETAPDAARYDSTLSYLAAHWHESGPINLLQGMYQARQPTSPTWHHWRTAAVLTGVWIGVAWLAMIAEGFYASSQADQLEAASESLYREIFPNEQRVSNVRRQLRAKLGSGVDGSGFVEHLGDLAMVMDPSTRILSLSYTDERAELAADLMVGGFEELDRIKEGLSSYGVAVEITSAEQQDNAVRARMRLQHSGADA